MNIPNSLSLLRLFLVTPFLLAVIYDSYGLALLLFVLAGFSDFLDGYLARRLDQKSLLGTFLDPLGDKLLMTVAFVALAVKGALPAWLAVLVVAKDLYVALGSGVLHLAGNVRQFPPSIWGKLSTLLQVVAVALVLVAILQPALVPLLSPLFVGTAIVTIVAGVHYVWRGMQGFAVAEKEGDDIP